MGCQDYIRQGSNQDIVSCVSISVMLVLNRKFSRSSNFGLDIKMGPSKPVFENYRAFSPLRLKIELSVQKNEATFVVNASWLLKDHTKRLKTELEKRFFKARSLLPVIEWLKEDILQFLKLFKKNQLTYATPETDDWQSHYIAHRDPLTIHMLFEGMADKVALLEGSELVKAGTFDCPICYDHKSSMAAVIFPQCKHHFCRGCVSQDLSLKMDS
ncbi:hypothetical protein RvY_15166 [Ramazzottius varieornatus]|uniref:RING-type domain-containing protein n=1 Tax=Ramazzottius varieornatus TaxID=947166 RepID=A0A1D1W241_RAMVA|nr:hypothetical protein RvY_15166 [Ramazzottius varieornatus]